MHSIDQIEHLSKSIKNKHLIDYYGNDYVIADFGYDASLNYLLSYPRGRSKNSIEDKEIYKFFKPKRCLIGPYLPRALITKQLIAKKLIVLHWMPFLDGWKSVKEREFVKFETIRPNVIQLFSASKVILNTDEESLKAQLNKEINELKNLLLNITT